MNEAKDLILYVDDEPIMVKHYVNQLEAAFDLVYASRADEALGILNARAADFAAVVLDVMMPPPANVPDHETAGGFETGLWLLDMYRRNSAQRCLFPVIVLTNRSVRLIQDGLQRREIKTTCIDVLAKLDTPAFALPRLVRSAIEKHRAMQRH